MAKYRLFGNDDVIKQLNSEDFPTIDICGCLESRDNLYVGDFIYLVSNHFYEYAYKVIKRVFVDGAIFLQVERCALFDIWPYGYSSTDDTTFISNIHKYFEEYKVKHPDFDIRNENLFHNFVIDVYNALHLKSIPFSPTCMMYRISEIVARLAGIKWERPTFYQDF
ncbi:MAG: hypothetical protein [Wendovervirus sonii]|uniref:Uncharacterized protein n=1 Tax=phage Lak_Megaphage_Sonny TaxID=3109229 RepID=A0ABZ0Z3Z0_9CAUD|nr:MAG: hypothetical protein [phage Lak_Megaphage_Sonny]